MSRPICLSTKCPQVRCKGDCICELSQQPIESHYVTLNWPAGCPQPGAPAATTAKPLVVRPSVPVAACDDDRSSWPLVARLLAKMATPEDAGLGDVLQRQLSKLGGEWYKKTLAKLSLSCGCEKNQAALNKKFPLQ